MQTDVSCLIRLGQSLKDSVIGDGIRLEYVWGSKWWTDVWKDRRVAAKVELAGGYTHRFVVSLPGLRFSPDDASINDARQRIIRAIVLSRIVRPTSIASGGLWVVTECQGSNECEHFPQVNDGEYGRGYVTHEEFAEPILTDDNLRVIADLWPAMQRLFQEEPRYRRIVRALKFFDAGFHLWYAEFRHLVFHAALESMICTTWERNKCQVVQRLTALVPSVTKQQAEDIYLRCCDIKHTAAPFPDSPSDTLASDDTNLDRYDALNRLEGALRTLFRRILAEPKFAELIADPAALDKEHPVQTRRRKRKD